MMGTKVRRFGPLEQVSLEELVPKDHFYRHVERTLDLACVRELVQPCYALGGRPSVDPVVFFKTRLMHLLLAAAINFMRVADWLGETPRSRTQQSAFAALAGAFG